jgi:hypothetical protein
MGVDPGVMTYISADAPWHKQQEYTWFRGGDLNFKDIRHLLFNGGGGGPDHPLRVKTYITLDATYNKKQEYI